MADSISARNVLFFLQAAEAETMYLSEWLALSLEVRQLETKQKCFEMEMDNLKKLLEERCSLDDELNDFETETHSIRTEMVNFVYLLLYYRDEYSGNEES